MKTIQILASLAAAVVIFDAGATAASRVQASIQQTRLHLAQVARERIGRLIGI